MTSVDASSGIIMDNPHDNKQMDRREVRIHCRLNVQFRLGSLNDYGICWNLGLHGMYITYDGDVVQGDPIELSFIISDEYPSLVEVVGRVAWINIGEHHVQQQTPEGFGVEFISISADARSAIQKFIELY